MAKAPPRTSWGASLLVARFGVLIEEAVRKHKLPAAAVPLMLAMIEKETGGTGDPSLKNKIGAIGLGQQIPRLIGREVPWSPAAQIDIMGDLLAHYLDRRRTGGHLPSAWLAYASGPGSVSALVQGKEVEPFVDKHLNVYQPSLVDWYDVYGRWYSGWIAAGRPSESGEVASHDGDYDVQLAVADVPEGPRLRSPFDGEIRWGGRVIERGTVGDSGGIDPAALHGAATATDAINNAAVGVSLLLAILGVAAVAWWRL